MYSRLKSWVAGCLILLGMLAGENAHGQATGPGYALLLTNATLTITGISNTIPTNEITIEFWQRSSTSNSLYTFQLLPNASGNVCEAYLPYLNGQIMWMYGNTSSGTLSFYPSNPPTGYWQHFAFVASYASNYMAVYRNGVLEGRKTGMVPLTPGARNLVFGNTGAQSVELDEIRIWNQARSASQILTNMCRSLTGTESNLVAYWRCDEGTGTNALDSGPNGLTGGILRPIWEPSTAPVQFPGGTTLPVNGVTDNSAALRANLLAGGFDTQGWFRYGETTNYGSLTPPLTVAATNYNLVNVTNFISQLATGRIYHCQFICTNAAGTNVGRDFTFMTLFPFTANITANSASLRLTSTNPWLEPAAAWFRYGPTTNYATNTTKYIGGYDGFVLFYTATGLNPGSIYHYQLVVTNVYGTNYGVDYTFTTLSNNLATLTNLTLSTGLGALVPPFATATTSYQAAVANGYSTVAVVPTLTDSNATVQVAINGGPYTPVVSGNPSPDLPVVPGQNVINILVTAQNLTTTKLYVLNAFVDTNPIVVSTTLATGPGSLAAAINQANLFNSPHLIHLATNGLYVYSNADNYWYGPNALPPVAADITVEGHGACLQINNSNRLRFFYIGADPAAPATINYTTPGAGRLTLHQLTLQGGLARGGDGGGGGAGMGGAIFNQGTVALDAVTLANNTAQGGNGGGFAFTLNGAAGGGLGGNGFGGSVYPGGAIGSATGGGGGGGFGATDAATNSTGGGPADGLGGGGGASFGGGSVAGVAGTGGHGSGGGGSGPGGAFGFTGASPLSFGASGAGGGVGGGGGGGQGSPSGSFASGFGGGGGGGFGGGGGTGASAWMEALYAGQTIVGYFTGGGGSGNGGFGGGAGGYALPNGAQGGFGGGSGTSNLGDGGGGGAGMGGALFNHGGRVTLLNCTLANNSARGGSRGSLYFDNGGAGLGGAIFNLNGSVTLSNSTLAANTTTGPAVNGGALYNLAYDSGTAQTAAAVLVNSIFGQNPGGMDVVNDQPAMTTGGTNLSSAVLVATEPNIIQNFINTGGTPNTGGIIATNPLLGPLAYNGGPTPTMALLPGSPAAQAGDVAAAPGTDQQGNPRLTGGSLNLGAVQFQAGSAPAQFLAGGTVTGANLQFQFTGNTGAGYSVFASSNLFLPLTNWIYLGAATQISLGLFQFQVTSGTNVGQYYYRVSQP